MGAKKQSIYSEMAYMSLLQSVSICLLGWILNSVHFDLSLWIVNRIFYLDPEKTYKQTFDKKEPIFLQI